MRPLSLKVDSKRLPVSTQGEYLQYAESVHNIYTHGARFIVHAMNTYHKANLMFYLPYSQGWLWVSINTWSHSNNCSSYQSWRSLFSQHLVGCHWPRSMLTASHWVLNRVPQAMELEVSGAIRGAPWTMTTTRHGFPMVETQGKERLRPHVQIVLLQLNQPQANFESCSFFQIQLHWLWLFTL